MSKGDTNPKSWVPTVVSVGLLLLTAIGLFLEYRPREGHASVQSLSTERLTPSLEIPGLRSTFMFREDTVRSLWKTRLRFVNDGEVTLVTQGQRQNVIGGSIPVSVDSSVRILGISEEASSFPNDLKREGDHLAHFGFLQWRPGEGATYSIYLESPSSLDSIPLPSVPVRAIVDGSISVENRQALGEEDPESWAAYLPDPVHTVGRVLGIAFCGAASLTLLLLLVIGVPVERFRIALWRRRNGEEFEEYSRQLVDEGILHDSVVDEDLHDYFVTMDEELLVKTPALSDMDPRLIFGPRTFDEVIQKPWRLPEEAWDDFPGERCPVSSPLASTTGEALQWFVFGIFAVVALGTLTLTALPV